MHREFLVDDQNELEVVVRRRRELDVVLLVARKLEVVLVVFQLDIAALSRQERRVRLKLLVGCTAGKEKREKE